MRKEGLYNIKQIKAYCLIAFNNWKNSGNKNDTKLKTFEMFLDPVFKIYNKKNAIKTKEKLQDKEDKI